MKNIFVIVTLSFAFLFSNCSYESLELLKTTYQRSFNKEIIKKYLHSEKPEEVKAALISISHSGDTSFIPMLKQIDFNKFSELICFAIGQIGQSTVSTKFLWFKVYGDDFFQNSEYIFEAIGKTGTSADLEKINEVYANFDGPVFPYDGISLAIRQFAFRGIENETAKQILIDEATNPLTSIERKCDALFTLARIGSSPKLNSALIDILKSNDFEEQNIELKQYALMNFSAQKYFEDVQINFSNLMSETAKTLLEIEIAKTVYYKEVNTQEELNILLSLLDAPNPNVSRAAANSLRNIKFQNEELKIYLESFLLEKINDDLNPHTLGELVVSMVSLFPSSFAELPINIFSSKIHIVYLFEAAGINPEGEINLNLLIGEFLSERNLKDEIPILKNLIKFQRHFPKNDNLNNILLSSLKSEDAPLVSIAADGVDSFFIVKNSAELKKIIPAKIYEELNNPDFIEGIMSLTNLAEKIDKDFYNEVIEIVKNSSLYSIRKFISDKAGINYKGEKELTHFEEIVNYSFIYKAAEIKTAKGNITIEFLPVYAPITIGNFCKLAENGFYNEIEFHRVVPGFVVQAGDPSGTGWGGPGYDIISEFSPLPFETGMVGMASAGKDTESSQFFIMQGNYPHLNGRYSLFAQVIEGMHVVYNLDQGDKIESIKLLY